MARHNNSDSTLATVIRPYQFDVLFRQYSDTQFCQNDVNQLDSAAHVINSVLARPEVLALDCGLIIRIKRLLSGTNKG